MGPEVDKTDFLILKCLHEAEQPLWKNKIHDCQLSLFDRKVSVQTIGRRVDRLHDQGLLKSCIVSPDDIKRDLIIGYQLTEDGKKAMDQTRRRILVEAIKPTLFQEADVEKPITKRELVDLMTEELELESGIQKQLEQEYTWEELTAILTLYLVKHRMEHVLNNDALNRLAEIAAHSPHLSNTLTDMADSLSD